MARTPAALVSIACVVSLGCDKKRSLPTDELCYPPATITQAPKADSPSVAKVGERLAGRWKTANGMAGTALQDGPVIGFVSGSPHSQRSAMETAVEFSPSPVPTILRVGGGQLGRQLAITHTIVFQSSMTNPLTTSESLLLRRVRGMGRGIFAGRRFRKGEIIEICPVVPVSPRFAKKCDGEVLEHYLFQWGRRGSAVILGYGSIYNHSNNPNASFRPRMGKLELVFRALRDIEIGEQILVDYEWPDFHMELKKARRQSRR